MILEKYSTKLFMVSFKRVFFLMGQFGLKIIVTLLSQNRLTSHLAFHKQFCKTLGVYPSQHAKNENS